MTRNAWLKLGTPIVVSLLAGHVVKAQLGQELAPPMSYDEQQAAWSAAIMAYSSDSSVRHQCTATCNDQEVDLDSEDKATTCWGVWRVACQGEQGCAVAKCTGRFEGFPGHIGAACEGELAHFHAIEKEMPDGKEFVAISVAGCRGTATLMIGGKSDGGPISDFAFLSVADLGGLPGVAWANHSEMEGRCEGKSMDLKAFKPKPRGAPQLSADMAEALGQAEADAAMPGLLAAPPTPSPGLDQFQDTAPLHSFKDVAGPMDAPDRPPPPPKCELTCNGRPTWFHGALPCWGELRLTCEVHPEPHDCEMGVNSALEHKDDQGHGSRGMGYVSDRLQEKEVDEGLMGMVHGGGDRKLLHKHGMGGHWGSHADEDDDHHKGQFGGHHGGHHAGHQKDDDDDDDDEHFMGHHEGHHDGHDDDDDDESFMNHHEGRHEGHHMDHHEGHHMDHHEGHEGHDAQSMMMHMMVGNMMTTRMMHVDDPADDPDHHHHHHHHHHGFKFDARCRGWYSGRWFGNTCYGTSLAIADWGVAQKVSVCTEWQKVMAKPPGPHGASMVSLCAGKHLVAFKRGNNPDAQPADAPAAASEGSGAVL